MVSSLSIFLTHRDSINGIFHIIFNHSEVPSIFIASLFFIFWIEIWIFGWCYILSPFVMKRAFCPPEWWHFFFLLIVSFIIWIGLILCYSHFFSLLFVFFYFFISMYMRGNCVVSELNFRSWFSLPIFFCLYWHVEMSRPKSR